VGETRGQGPRPPTSNGSPTTGGEARALRTLTPFFEWGKNGRKEREKLSPEGTFTRGKGIYHTLLGYVQKKGLGKEKGFDQHQPLKNLFSNLCVCFFFVGCLFCVV